MHNKPQLTLEEAIVVALISYPHTRTATIEDIAEYIRYRKLFPLLAGQLDLETQVMLCCTTQEGEYHPLFEELGNNYIRLRNQIDPLFNFLLLDAVLDFNNWMFNPAAQTLSVIDTGFGKKETVKLKLSPSEIICITTAGKGRQKNIYVKKQTTSGDEWITCYKLNNNQFTFESLSNYLDPQSGHLAVISKSAIVNVAYYGISTKNKVKLNPSIIVPDDLPKEFLVGSKTTTKDYLETYHRIREAYLKWISLQKGVSYYKSKINF